MIDGRTFLQPLFASCLLPYELWAQLAMCSPNLYERVGPDIQLNQERHAVSHYCWMLN